MSPTAPVSSTDSNPILPPAAEPVASSEASASETSAAPNEESTEETAESAPEAAPASTFVSQFYPRIAAEGGFTLTDLDNGRGLARDHSGGYGRLEGGFEYSVASDVFIQANAAGSYGALSMGLGDGVTSAHDYVQLMLNGRVGWNALSGNFRLSGGLNVGVAHVGASSCPDGLSCGADFTRNPQLLPIDSWAMAFDVEAGISTLQGALSAYFRIGSMFGVNPRFDAIDTGSDVPNFGLNIPYMQVGFQAEVFSLIRAITGIASGPAAPEAETDEPDAGSDAGSETSESTEVEAGETSGESAPAPTGMALIRQRIEDVNTYLGQISAAGEAASVASTAYAAIDGTSVESNRDRRVQILEMVNQARTAADAVTHISELIEEARTAASSLGGAERREARTLVSGLESSLTQARTAASALYRQVQQNVAAFNALTPGEDVTIDFADPRPRRGRRTGSGGGGRGRSEAAGPTRDPSEPPRFRVPDSEDEDAGPSTSHPEPHAEPERTGGTSTESLDLEAGE